MTGRKGIAERALGREALSRGPCLTVYALVYMHLNVFAHALMYMQTVCPWGCAGARL